MARPKKYSSNAERQAAFKARRNVTDTAGFVTAPVTLPGNVTKPDFVPFRHQAHVPISLFDGAGRGSPRAHTDGHAYVLVSRHAGSDLGELGIVSLDDWHTRTAQACEHGLRGWSCHAC